MKIIGLSGRMKAGKSTVAEYLSTYIPDSAIHGFSDGIKTLAIDYFCENDMDFNSQEVKSQIHQSGKTYRQILQECGTKMREIWPEVWIYSWQSFMRFLPMSVCIVPDVRFPNEVKAIQDMGGIVIRLTRNPVDSDDKTETALDLIYSITDFFSYGGGCIDCEFDMDSDGCPLTFDHIIDNANMSIEITNQICLEIAKEYIDG